MPALTAKEYASILEGLNIYYVAGPDDFDLIVPAISELLAGESEYIGVDTETTGLHPRTDYVRLLQLSNGYSSLVIDLDAFRESEGGPIDWKHPQLKFVKRFLQKTEKTLTIHNAAFDVNFLVEAGIRFTRQKFFDTLIASRIINNGTGASNALDAVVKRRLGITISKEMQKSNFRLELSLDQIRYAAVDAAILCHLAPVLDELLYQNALSADRNLHNVFEIEMKALLPIVLMEHKGFGFDLPLARSQRILMVEEAERAKLAFCEALDARLAKKKGAPRLPRDPDGSLNLRAKTTGSVRLGTKKLAGYNPRSGPQTTHFMTAAGIRLRPNAKGKISLDQNLLSFLRHTNDLIDMYMVWKEKATLISHMDKLIKSTEKDGRIHAKYNQMGTKTGRLSSSGPNLQQVPKSKTFRSLLKASERKVLVKADYSQVELRVAAFFSREPVMLQAYLEGRDLHIETACRMTGKNPEDITQDERKSAKICFSGDTEVLTLSGWVRLADYQGQSVAQYELPAGVELNPERRVPGPGYVAGRPAGWDGNHGRISFVPPQRFEQFYSDDVWHVEDRNIDIVATGNHHILYLDQFGGAHKKPLVDVKSPRLMVAGGYYQRPPYLLSENQTRVLAMVVADGSFKQADGWVSFGFSKRRKIYRCKMLLEEANIEYQTSVCSNGENGKATCFKFKHSEAPWLTQFVSKDKELQHDNCMRSLNPMIYLEEAQYWDGTAKEGNSRDRIIVGTTVKQTADTMQAMAVTCGVPCTVHEEDLPRLTNGKFYRVSYAFRTTPTWRPSWNPVKTDPQQVYCVQVPSSLILIRRNGKVCVQGNCNFGLIYGAGPATLQRQAMAQYDTYWPIEEAREKVQAFREGYPVLFAWQRQEGEATTASIYTISGRRRIVQGTRDDKFTVRVNTKVQGTAGDIAKVAMGFLWDKLVEAPEGQADLISMVHDEIVMEVDEDAADQWAQTLKDCMENAGRVYITDVPIVADVGIGRNWAEVS